MTFTLRSANNFNRRDNSRSSSMSFSLPSRTIQDAREDSDINTIVRRFGVTGKIPVLPVKPEYGNFEGPATFHDAMNFIAKTNELFDSQPSHIRDYFKNDPQLMLDFVNNPDNIDEGRRLGIIKPDIQSSTTAPAVTETENSETEA